MKKWHQINTDYKNLQKIHDNPPLYECDHFLTDNECHKLIQYGKKNLRESTVVKLVNGKETYVKHTDRDSQSCFLNNDNIKSITNKLSSLVNKDSKYFEGVQVGHYNKGGFYKSHQDAIDKNTELGKQFIESRGQRIITVLIYLNDVPRGGCTYFDKLKLRCKPKKGKAVVFFPAYLDREIDQKALHCAETVIDEKWVSQLWIRDKIQ